MQGSSSVSNSLRSHAVVGSPLLSSPALPLRSKLLTSHKPDPVQCTVMQAQSQGRAWHDVTAHFSVLDILTGGHAEHATTQQPGLCLHAIFPVQSTTFQTRAPRGVTAVVQGSIKGNWTGLDWPGLDWHHVGTRTMQGHAKGLSLLRRCSGGSLNQSLTSTRYFCVRQIQVHAYQDFCFPRG